MANKKRALVQDDKAIFSGTIATLLKLRGFDVDVVTNGMEGLQQLGKGSYDLIFSDVEMPNMNGFEFLARLRKDPKYAKIPVVMCTTLDKPEHIQKALQLGANHYTNKPLTQPALEEALKKLGLA